MADKAPSPTELAKLLADGLAEVTTILRDLDRRLKLLELLVLPRGRDALGHPRPCQHRSFDGIHISMSLDCFAPSTGVYAIVDRFGLLGTYACCDEHRPEGEAILLRELPGKEQAG